MSTSSVTVNNRIAQRAQEADAKRIGIDLPLVGGLLVACGAIVLGISSAGLEVRSFLRPTAALIVFGATAGIVLITTPARAVLSSLRRLKDVFLTNPVNPHELVDEIVRIARVTRRQGFLGIETLARKSSHDFLREGLLLAIDVKTREELATTLETELRMKERQGEADAKTFEIAGGYAPTIGILGTVIGLIQVLRQFSDLELVATGISTAFLSTIYGLGLANLVLLPLAHRVRARVAETFEMQELILDGVLNMFDQVHPTLIRSRLVSHLRTPQAALSLIAGPEAEPAQSEPGR